MFVKGTLKFLLLFLYEKKDKGFSPFGKGGTVFFSGSLGKKTKRMRDRTGRSDLCKRVCFYTLLPTRVCTGFAVQATAEHAARAPSAADRFCACGRGEARTTVLARQTESHTPYRSFCGSPSRTGQGPLPHRLFAAACSAALFCTKGQAMRLRLLFRSFSFRKEKEQGLLPFGKGKPSQKNGRIRVRFFFISFRKGGRPHRRVPAGCRHAR